MARKHGQVKSEMGGGFPRPPIAGAKGVYDASPGPFNKRHDLGNGGIPLKFQETGPSKGPTPTQTAGRLERTPRPGTVQRKFGVSDE
jgi:hypothetical protein